MAGGNQYSEKWTFDECKKFMEEAVSISEKKGFDFIGEVAKKQGTYRDVYDYITDKFKVLKPLLKQLKSNCEANCFSDGKNGDIVPSLAIMNLKSNHGWTDRNEVRQEISAPTGKIIIQSEGEPPEIS